MTEETNGGTNRRSILTGAAVIGAAATFGTGTLLLGSRPAAAELFVSDHLQFEGGSMQTSHGEVAYLASGFQGYVWWENQPSEVKWIWDEMQFNWDTEDIAGGDKWHALHYDVSYKVESPPYRDWDTGQAGHSGHFTRHVPNPDGSLLAFVEDLDDEPGKHTFSREPKSLPAETDDRTWIVARNDAALDRLEAADATFPYAFNRDYGAPQNRLDAADIPVPDEGEEHTLTVGYRRFVSLLANPDMFDGEIDLKRVDATFDLTIEHLGEGFEVTEVGEVAADGA